MSAVPQLRRDDSATDDRADLQAIIRERSFRKGDFLLASGVRSTRYFDLKPTMMSPRGALLSARAFLDMIHAQGADYVGGLEMGAVPITGALAAVGEAEGRPVATFFVRKQPKGHGTGKRIEGLADTETLSGRRVLLIEDVATTGASIMKAVEPIREAGGLVNTALVLVDREEGADAYLAQNGIRLLSVFRGSDFD